MLYNLFKEQKKKLKKLNYDVIEIESTLKKVVNNLIWIEIESYINKLLSKEKEIINTRHNKKFSALKIAINQQFDNKLLYNFSYRALSSAEESLLEKGWKYAIKLDKINTLSIKTDIEYMYHCMEKSLLLNNIDKTNRVKTLLNEFGNKLKNKIDKEIPNLSSEELNAISTLIKEHSLVISKVDKGNAIVVMNKSDYLMKAKELLNDTKTFEKLKHNLTDSREQEFIKFLLQLKRNKIITPEEYKQMRPDTGSRTPEA
ncbi:unnamed protein product, partial [Rotaria sp. Silwood1]